MIQPVRAAAFAVAAFVALSLDGTALFASPDEAAAPTAHYLDHSDAVADSSDLGVNGEAQSAAAGTVATLASAHQEAADETPRRQLAELVVDQAGAVAPANNEQGCLASAVYFEARGESLEGQLAVAEVVLNRTRSGRYPGTICAVVRQPAQFSFVRRGVIPRADPDCAEWRRAIAIARIAEAGETRLLPQSVLWYHANYVSPGWGRRLARNTRIGAHIFYS
jgi:spore germination cell wall hydrolase CwlJ-like protein